MLRKDPKTGRKVAIGAAIAGIGGYLAGILTAPKSGEETRQDIANKAADIKDDAGAELQKASEELAGVIKEAKDKAGTISAKAREEFNETVIRAKEAQNKAGQVLKAVRAGEAADPELNKAVKQAAQAKKNLAKFLKS